MKTVIICLSWVGLVVLGVLVRKSEPAVLAVLLTMVAMVVLCALTGWGLWKSARLVETWNTIAEIRPGLTYVRGEVVPVRTIRSPINERECVYFQLTTQKRADFQIDADYPMAWSTARTEEKSVEFLVKDNTGVALVKAEGAQFIIREGPYGWYPSSEDPNGWRFIVDTIVEGESVAVVGMARAVSEYPDAGLTGERFAIESGGTFGLLVYADIFAANPHDRCQAWAYFWWVGGALFAVAAGVLLWFWG